MLSRPYCFIVFLLFLIPFLANAQAIDNTESFRSINSDKYFRVYYENDFFTGKDRDYTQGIYIEKVHPAIRHFFLTKILWHPKNGSLKYGLAIEHDAYTPNYIDRAAIQYGDRPYAATLMLKTFITARNRIRKERISAVLSTGVIGPWAGGEQMQRTIHHWINYTQPLGWHNQLSNDLVLNYQLNYEKELLSAGRWLSVSSYSTLRAGTLSDKLSTGFSLMTGNFYSPYQATSGLFSRKWRWHLYYQPLISLVGYDATLEGPIFNHTSPYTIPVSDIKRLTFQHKYGIVLIRKGFYVEYFQTGLTEEFKYYVFHRTGGIQIGFGF
jgi:hypothetical protein